MSYEAFIGWIKENIFWVIMLVAFLLLILQKKIRGKIQERKLESAKKKLPAPPPPRVGPFGVEGQSQFRKHTSLLPEQKYVVMMDSYKQQIEGDIKDLCEALHNLDCEAASFNKEYNDKMVFMNKKYVNLELKRDKLIMMLNAVDSGDK